MRTLSSAEAARCITCGPGQRKESARNHGQNVKIRRPMTDDPSAAPAAVPSNLAGTWRAADRYGFLVRNGARLRYACWNVPGTRPRGSVVL